MSNFEQFFRQATTSDRFPHGVPPYPYQERLATRETFPSLINAPTGSGKTGAVILAWLFRRQSENVIHPSTPRRLVYCLPMRVLVEQSYGECERWLQNLGLHDDVGLHQLMGGVDSDEWHLNPGKPAILIGTQDMLLSRALNRGYAANRCHWPIDFGLLNNDCLWVFDEPQLMGSGVSTSAQLAGLRQSLNFFGECPSLWMSATLEPAWLDTIDFRGKFPSEPFELDESDYAPDRALHKRMTAEKTLRASGLNSSKDMKEAARYVFEKHTPGSQTLVILNTVDRAKDVYDGLRTLRKKAELPELLLVHSRFRLAERQTLNQKLQEKGEAPAERIIVATQVVEAGVDISAQTLIIELAPWASIVQRIGRCNRTGDDGPGRVFWFDLEGKLSPPYSEIDLDFSRKQLNKLNDKNVSPKALNDFKRSETIDLPFEHKHVLRRRDLLDLFDTAPDLSGNDIDIQRFVRGDDLDIDVQVFWRDMTADGWDASPVRRELCNVPVGNIKRFLQKEKVNGFSWDFIDDQWKPIRDPNREIRPGMTILLPHTAGGYDWDGAAKIGKGWDPDSKAAVVPSPPEKKVAEEGMPSDPNCASAAPLTISQHTANVCKELGELLQAIDIDSGWSSHLSKAARWHDVGKAHWAFQQGMRRANPNLGPEQLWAKSGSKKPLKHGRRYFRHELASGLAALQQQLPFEVAYLIGAHHGRVRIAIRAVPGEKEPQTRDTLFALGVHHGDKLPEVDLGNETCPAITLDLSPMQLGGERSWTAKALKLLAELGPFRLAYLEALLRIADVRASRKEASNE
jgi:CRISPR-associated endonuclease/helicase Cas3